MFAAPLRFFRPAVEYNLTIHIEALPLDKNLSLDSADLESANFDPDPIDLGSTITLHSYLAPLYREKSPIPRSPAARSPLRHTWAQCDQIGSKPAPSLEENPIGEIDLESASKVLGDVRGLKALDLGCGMRRWSKWLVENGAEVVGIDTSEPMITSSKEMQLELRVKDWGTRITLKEDEFDVVLGAWCLSNVPDHAALVTMFRNILANLRPGGRVLGIVPSAFCPMHDTCLRTKRNEQEGEAFCRCTLQCQPDNVRHKTTVGLHRLFEKAAQEAGMGETKWRPYVLSKDQREEEGFWDEFGYWPDLCLLECHKPA
ncbi:hypothetical protein CERZMDRAFT_92671 [Cercospora zeae-maydis SCOH1-5]|uniref:Methyltransferase domain-containing protein n=1 Tax=Cercospora zeae-maydis SCOH1-5 TaxID=717836 RepID=A0A6A6FX31_9PEZI|nr:hypothetical protein CERZMDRAFT_92671 [Cercospora zeae-maydis SCOH1-5]